MYSILTPTIHCLVIYIVGYICIMFTNFANESDNTTSELCFIPFTFEHSLISVDKFYNGNA